MTNKFAKWVFVFFIGLVLNGCSYLTQMAPLLPCIQYLDFSGSNLTTIKIQSTKTTNYGAPFYILVKATDFPTFLTDDYEKIVSLVINPDNEQECFATICIVPGINQKLKVSTPDDKSIAIYCLFTNPGEAWKHIFELEEKNQTIKLLLGEHEIISIEK